MEQKIKGYVSKAICYGCILHVDLPKEKTDKNYDRFHIEMIDLKNRDEGEHAYFMQKHNYK